MKLHKYYMIVLDDEKEIDSCMRKAAFHRVQCLYKIGIYGKEKQHEIFIGGRLFDCLKFMAEWRREHAKLPE